MNMATRHLIGAAALGAALAAAGIAQAADFDRAATFRYGHSFVVAALDPAITPSMAANAFLFPIFDRLVHQKIDGTYEPMLAASWEFSADNKKVTFKLRQGVRFHDGAAFDATAAKANLDRMLTLKNSTAARRLAMVKSVEAPAPDTLVVNVESGAGPLLGELSDIPGMMMSPASFDKADLDRNPVGSGPYRIKAINDGKSLVYERFDGYWDPNAAHTAILEIHGIADDNTRLNALVTGAVDAALGREHMVDRISNSGKTLLTEPWGSASYQLAVNTSKAPFDKKEVRQALNFAIDREAISKGLMRGTCSPSVQQFSETSWAYNPKIKASEVYPHNVAKAKELLAAAGVANGFTFTASSVNISGFMAVAQAVQNQLAAIGVKMEITSLDAASYRKEFTSGKADALVTTSIPAADPTAYVSPEVLKKSVDNPGGLELPAVEAAYRTAMDATDQPVRQKALQDLGSALIEGVPGVVKICMRPLIMGVDKKVQGLAIYSTGQLDFRGVGIAK